MSKAQKPDDENAGAKRAHDFHDAMLAMPGYGDDSMFFVVRYMAKASDSLCDADFKEFMQAFGELYKLNNATGDEEASAREEKKQEVRQRALDKVHDFPDLVRDFDRMVANAHHAERISGGKWPRANEMR